MLKKRKVIIKNWGDSWNRTRDHGGGKLANSSTNQKTNQPISGVLEALSGRGIFWAFRNGSWVGGGGGYSSLNYPFYLTNRPLPPGGHIKLGNQVSSRRDMYYDCVPGKIATKFPEIADCPKVAKVAIAQQGASC